MRKITGRILSGGHAKLKIILIYPLLSNDRSKVDENKQYWPPLGIAYIAGMLLNNGHQVKIIDRDLVLRREGFDLKKADEVVLKEISAFGPAIVGFSATTPNISDVRAFSSQVKKMNPGILTVLGGPHVTGEAVYTLQICPDIDIAVRGEGEETMLEIAGLKSPERILGIHYRLSDGRIIANPDRPLIEVIDNIPHPARSSLDMRFYTRPSRFTSRNLNLRTSHVFTARGCPYSCHYCAGPLMGRNKVRYHSSKRVLEEINELIDVYKVEAVYFAEDMFLAQNDRAREILNLFIDSGINKKIVWMAQLSSKIVNSELLGLMKKAGCIHVEYGFESGSQKILDLMNKRTTIEQNLKAAMLTKKLGMRFQGNFIVGFPGETEEDFNATINFIKKVKPNQVSVNMFMPLPGTFIHNRLKEQKKLLPGWDDIGNQDAPQLNYADMLPSRFEELYWQARVKVIIPINLVNFLAANLSDPPRLAYVVLTQSLGLSIKFIRAIRRLIKLKLSGGKTG